MNKKMVRQSYQRALDFSLEDRHRKLPDSEREECRKLLAKMLVDIVQGESAQEDEDE